MCFPYTGALGEMAKKFRFIYVMYMSVLSVCTCVYHVHACGDQKRVLDPCGHWKPELSPLKRTTSALNH